MKKRLSFYFILVLLVFTVSSCSNEDEIITEETPTKSLTVEYNTISEKSLNTQSTSGDYFTLTLTVYDSETGEPLPYATVEIKGTTKGQITDAQGTCKIVVKPGDILVVSYLGYQPKEYKVIVSVSGAVYLAPILN